MTEPNRYYRNPNRPFRCGLSKLGKRCTHGPVGGACGQTDSNQDKCYPIRTLTGWARMASAFLTLLSVAVLLFVLPSTTLKSTIAPGPLSNPHAQLLQKQRDGNDPHSLTSIDSENRCLACHPTSNGLDSGTTAIPGLFVKSHSGTQSQLCMKCHLQGMPNGLEGSPHDMVGDQLVKLNRSMKPRSTALSKTECSQCHREHRGSGEDLQSITSQRCQSCHQQQFDSFSHGHPELKDYPESQLRSIAFDHSRHKDIHFQKKNSAFDCRTCHVNNDDTGAVGSVFRSVSYENACAKCHDEPLKSGMSEGLVVLQIPSLDRAKLKLAGLELGEWPESASQLMDGTLSPLLVEMLKANRDGSDIVSKLPPSGKLRDFNLADHEQAKVVIRLADQVRSVFAKLATEGQPWIRKSLEERFASHSADSEREKQRLVSQNSDRQNASMASVTLGAPRTTPASAWLDQLSGSLPPDLVRSANQRWFPVMIGPGRASGNSTESPVAKGMIRQPQSLVTWKTDDAKADSNDLLGGDLLGGDLLDGDLLLTPGPSTLESNKLGSKEKPLRPWEHLPYGGWMLDESRVALVYVPNGHADPWVSRWIEWQKLTSDPHADGVSESNIAQRCSQCHSFNAERVRSMLDGPGQSNIARLVAWSGKQASGPLAVNRCWKIEQRSSLERTITKFSHTPHLTIPALADCQSCHVLQNNSSDGVGTHGWSEAGMILHHEFQSMQLQNCTNCHTKQSAGDACTQCHNYHVNTFSAHH